MDGLSQAPSCKQERDAVASSPQVPSKEGCTSVCTGMFSKTAAILVTTLENEAPRVSSDFPISSSSAVPSFSTAIFKAFAKMNTLGSADGHWFAVVTFWSDKFDEAVVSYLGTGVFITPCFLLYIEYGK